ncbi:MAG: hypothetical protein GY817_06955 [bacterium]|nr:hypothetical protein [bacterium]
MSILIFLASLIPDLFYSIAVGEKYYILKYTNYFYLYLIFILTSFCIIFSKFTYCVKNFTGNKRVEAQYILTGGILFTGTTLLTGVIFPSLGVETVFGIKEYYYFDTVSSIFFSLSILICLINNKLMDINLAWRKIAKETTYYIFLVSYVSLILYILHSQSFSYIQEVIIATIFSLIFLFVHNKFKEFLHNRFLGKYKKIWDNLRNISNIKRDTYDKRPIYEIIVHGIEKALDLSYAAYYDITTSSETYLLHYSTDFNYYDKGSPYKQLAFEDPLVKKLYQTRSCLYLEHLYKDPNNAEIVKIFTDLKIELCFPLFDAGKETLMGILVYGKKKSNTLFHLEDLELLDEIVKEAESQLNNIIKVREISEIFSADILAKYKKTYQVKIFNETKRLGEIRNLKHFTEHAIKVINRFLNASETEIYLLDEEKRRYYNPLNPKEKTIKERNYLVRYLEENKEMVLASTLKKWASE